MTYSDRTIDGFLDGVASRRVTPAGGTAAAVVGAIGTSLCEMVCIHTIAADDTTDVKTEMEETRDVLATQRRLLLELADRDSEAVDELLRAADDGSRTAAAKRATGVPLAIAEASLAVLERAPVVTEMGTPNAVPDAVSGALVVRSAIRASVFTVRSNVERLSDPSFAEEMETRAAEVERSADRALADVTKHVDVEC